jgi:hypothetical protein
MTRTAAQLSKFLFLALFVVLAPAALASNTWYVDGVNGNDSNDCLSSQSACKTIGHAISLCLSGHSIMVAPAIYTENLTINISLKIIGSDAATTIVDGNQAGTVFTVSNTEGHVWLSKLTIRNGSADVGGGINNSGTLTIANSTITGNSATGQQWGGGGIHNSGTLTINTSTISNNSAGYYGGGVMVHFGTTTINKSTVTANLGGYGGGIADFNGALVVNRSTVSANQAGFGGGIFDNLYATLVTVSNSTISGNSASDAGGGIMNIGTMTINSSTLNGNSSPYGGGIFGTNVWGGQNIALQNTIVANSPSGGNCYLDSGATINSNGYNLSSDDTCSFTGLGDMNNTDPKLGKFGKYGGPTRTILLLPGSPAIDAGNPSGCTDDKGNLLKTDQRGYPRPGKYDAGGCDMGAFERQHD